MIDINKNFENKMVYPQEFIDACLSLYPDNEDVKKYINTRSFLLGNLLRKLIPNQVSDEEINEAHENNEMKDILSRIDDRFNKRKLYLQFKLLYEEQYLSKGKFISNYGLVIYSPEAELNYKIEHGLIKPDGKITKSQLISLQQNISDRLDQNAQRRRRGSDIAGRHISD